MADPILALAAHPHRDSAMKQNRIDYGRLLLYVANIAVDSGKKERPTIVCQRSIAKSRLRSTFTLKGLARLGGVQSGLQPPGRHIQLKCDNSPSRTAWPSIYGCAQCPEHASIDAVLARVCAPRQRTGSNERLSNWPSTPTRKVSLFVRRDSGRRQNCGDRAEDQMTTSHYDFIMISLCGALEPTKKKWRDLMVAAGFELQVVRMYDGDEGHQLSGINDADAFTKCRQCDVAQDLQDSNYQTWESYVSFSCGASVCYPRIATQLQRHMTTSPLCLSTNALETAPLWWPGRTWLAWMFYKTAGQRENGCNGECVVPPEQSSKSGALDNIVPTTDHSA
ncbi:hypothetical protein M409DRAFT_51630 [Zasmidium cellare ATCC 36951]|uniref:Uncharacterized protein n=1 Tax=Zasmidium cellare ATCC 36951 TaxID=1080233 RepID=A0A6A6CXN4_ZASCE|nr:uncharacterized protein M409DRAFT_51630 [Zasmidium cellare ATCC 36951]KAF2170622.1 hypothetical protein M409DRAFT_51630 [Zasmidium cellare ATCC 36951]